MAKILLNTLNLTKPQDHETHYLVIIILVLEIVVPSIKENKKIKGLNIFNYNFYTQHMLMTQHFFQNIQNL